MSVSQRISRTATGCSSSQGADLTKQGIHWLRKSIEIGESDNAAMVIEGHRGREFFHMRFRNSLKCPAIERFSTQPHAE